MRRITLDCFLPRFCSLLTFAFASVVLILLAVCDLSAQTCNLNGTVTLNFDSVTVAPGQFVDATSYLASYGVSWSSPETGAGPIISNTTQAGSAVIPTSAPNVFATNSAPGLNNSDLTYTLSFCNPLSSVTFSAAAIVTTSTQPKWTATAYNADGTQVGQSVGQPDGFGTGAAQEFVISGAGITSLVIASFNSDARTVTDPPIDNLRLEAAPPVPLISQPLVPDAAAPGGVQFTLTVNGAGFASNSVVNWNGAALTTTFVGESQLTATVPASNIATATTAPVTVTNPAPGGGTSNQVFFPVTNPTSNITMSKTDYGTGAEPYALAAGDFNRDGKLDLAVTNINDNSVSILLGNGDGTFQTQSVYAVGTQPDGIAIGDFRGVGKLDLAVANVQDATVSILLGNGDGTFQPQTVYAVGVGPVSIATADFNGDGKLDLGVANANGTGTVSILLGNGDGTFQPQNVFSTGSAPGSAVAGDFNGDGNIDLVVVNFNDNTVSILLGNGDGTFQAQSVFPAGSTPNSVITADFNGDGKLDLAVTNAISNTISILLGNGDGTLQSPLPYATGQYPVGVTTGDLNGDGELDLAVVNGNDGTVSVLLGYGDATFQGQMVFPTTFAGGVIVTGDFNGDGRLDLAVTDCCSSQVSAISVFLQSPIVTLNSTSLNFGNQVVGTTSPSQQVSITNSGSAVLTISNLSFTGQNSSEFGYIFNCGLPAQVQPGQSCSVLVFFTPAAPGARTAALSISDNAPGTPQTVSLSGTGVPQVSVTTTSLPNGTVGTAYNQMLAASGGTTPYTWSVMAGSLAPLTLDPATGVISGTPTTVGTLNFTVQVKDANAKTATQALSIVVSPAPPMVMTTSLPGGTINTAYAQTTLAASGGTPPYTWSASTGSLPPGISVSAAGVVSGMPTVVGTFDFTIQVKDAIGATATQALSIAVVAPIGAPTCQPPTVQIDSSGTNPNPLSVTATSNCTDSTGMIASTTIDWGDGTAQSPGTSAPHTYTAAGTYSITVTATDTNNLSDSASGSVTVAAPLATPVMQGQAAQQTAMVMAPLGVPSVTVTYTCGNTINGPSGPQTLAFYHITSCKVTPATVTLTSTPTLIQVTVQTTGATAELLRPGLRRGGAGPLYAALLVLPGIGLVGIGWSTKRRKVVRYAVLALLCVFLWCLLACGGGSSSMTQPTSIPTPLGSYGGPVTGTSSGGTTTSTITIGFTVS